MNVFKVEVTYLWKDEEGEIRGPHEEQYIVVSMDDTRARSIAVKKFERRHKGEDAQIQYCEINCVCQLST